MPSTFPTELTPPTVLGAAPTSCDLCHATEIAVARDAIEGNCRILICENCRLMYRSPQLTTEALDHFYDDTFANDPGCLTRAGADFPPDKDRKKEEILAETWGIKIIKRFIKPRGKTILDLRCRTGALTSILQGEGAEVLGVEPFQGNANYARQVRGLSHIIDLPFSRFNQFPLPNGILFDAVNVLGHHVLAHVLSPRVLLERIFDVLKPGGFLFLDEKDVLLPARHKKQSALDSGPAHQYHLTLHSTGSYLRSSGFELLECEIDKYRISDFRHIRVVARKPEKNKTASDIPHQLTIPVARSVEAIHRRLWWLERTWHIRLAKVRYKRKFQRKLQKWGW